MNKDAIVNGFVKRAAERCDGFQFKHETASKVIKEAGWWDKMSNQGCITNKADKKANRKPFKNSYYDSANKNL